MALHRYSGGDHTDTEVSVRPQFTQFCWKIRAYQRGAGGSVAFRRS